MKLSLDHIAVVIAIGAIVILSIWPLPSHHNGGDEHGGEHGDAHGEMHDDGHGNGHNNDAH